MNNKWKTTIWIFVIVAGIVLALYLYYGNISKAGSLVVVLVTIVSGIIKISSFLSDSNNSSVPPMPKPPIKPPIKERFNKESIYRNRDIITINLKNTSLYYLAEDVNVTVHENDICVLLNPDAFPIKRVGISGTFTVKLQQRTYDDTTISKFTIDFKDDHGTYSEVKDVDVKKCI